MKAKKAIAWMGVFFVLSAVYPAWADEATEGNAPTVDSTRVHPKNSAFFKKMGRFVADQVGIPLPSESKKGDVDSSGNSDQAKSAENTSARNMNPASQEKNVSLRK